MLPWYRDNITEHIETVDPNLVNSCLKLINSLTLSDITDGTTNLSESDHNCRKLLLL